MQLVLTFFFDPTFLLFYTLDFTSSHAGSSHQLPQTPLSCIHVGHRTSKLHVPPKPVWEILLLYVLAIPCRKVAVTTACFPALGSIQNLFLLLIHKREDSALLIIILLFCLGAIGLDILG